MKRFKRIYALLAVLLVACLITFGVSQYETRKEQIKNSDEVILEIPTDSVKTLSWENETVSLSFHKDDAWVYDDDDAFPVDEEKINELLSQFEAFGVSFIIEDVEDFGQYGLNDPVCTINIGTEDQEYTVLLGDYSAMDSERYVSIGDGNVYLVQNDPLDSFDAELSDVIKNDEVPAFDQVTEIRFSGEEEYQIRYEEDSTETYREEDVYFTQVDGETLPLDTSEIETYLSTLQNMDMTEYMTYNATQEDLETYGLADPELTMEIDYTTTDEDDNETSGSFVLSVSHDPSQPLPEESESEATQDESEETEEEEITAYARVGESPIVYKISTDAYKALMASSIDDFRHKEVVPANFENIAQVDIVLEDVNYTISSKGEGDDRTYYYGDEELEIDELQSALQALSADSFTDEEPTQREEIDLTLTLDLEGSPTVHVELYRYDGDHCLAVVDGEPISLVARDSVVDLVEAVNSIVLNG